MRTEREGREARLEAPGPKRRGWEPRRERNLEAGMGRHGEGTTREGEANMVAGELLIVTHTSKASASCTHLPKRVLQWLNSAGLRVKVTACCSRGGRVRRRKPFNSRRGREAIDIFK